MTEMAHRKVLASLFFISLLFLLMLLQGSVFSIANVRCEELRLKGEEIVHPGELIVDGNQTFLVENCTFVVEGIVVVRDNATLVVRDAELNVSTLSLAGMVTVRDNGMLLVEDGDLNLNYDLGPHLHIYYKLCDIAVTDTATLKFENARLFSNLGRPLFNVTRYGRVILNSTDTCAGRIEALDDSAISIFESPVETIDLRGNSSCVVRNADVVYFKVSERCTASFYNSTIGNIHFYLGNYSKATIERRLQGFHRYWNIHTNFTVDGFEYNLTLHDSAVTGLLGLRSSFDFTGIELRVYNQNLLLADCGADSELYMSNCTCKHLSCVRQDSVYSINNSEIGSMSVYCNPTVSISETKIDELDVWDFKGVLICDNVILNEELQIDCIPGIRFYLRGGLRFGPNFTLSEWPQQRFRAIRGYRVVTRRDGKPLPNVQLKLYDDEDRLTWEGTTDNSGEVNFDVTYYRNWTLPPGRLHTNYTNTLRLEATHGPNSYTTELGLLSDTPITFNFPKPKPLWTLWQFWTGISILTIAVILTTFQIYKRRRALHDQTNV